MFTVYKVNLDNSLSHKEHLDSVDELNLWIAEKYGKFATIKIIADRLKHFCIMTDNGTWFEKIKSKEM
mgnify:FL=1|jgi:hypothetical protein|tara:strand:+ start:340 stop:543 length:204 start_codon:yes stop_codon:yes gene_type:complete